MRPRIAPSLPEREIRRRTPHELVRDFPETLTVFRRHGLILPEVGARPLDAVLDEAGTDSPESIIRDLREALGWRAEE